MRLGEARRALVKAYDANKEVMRTKREIRRDKARPDFPIGDVVWRLKAARTNRDTYLRAAGRIIFKGR